MSSLLHKHVNPHQSPKQTCNNNNEDQKPDQNEVSDLNHSMQSSRNYNIASNDTEAEKSNESFNLIKSYSENDLRILSNPCAEASMPNNSPSKNGASGSAKSNRHYTKKLGIGEMRSDYIILEAGAGKEKNGPNPFCRRLMHRNSAMICDHKNDQCCNGTNTVVVVPSIDLDGDELKRISPTIEFYEERQLYHLLLLSDPTFRVIFLSTHPICQDIVLYYLSLDQCSNSDLNDRLSRLFLLTPDDDGFPQATLSSKVVNDHKLMLTIREIVSRVSHGSAPSAGLNVFCGSDCADKLSSQLDMRLLEASGSTLYYGSKQGSRELFRSCNVPHAPGTPDVGDEDLLTSLPDAKLSIERHKFIRSPKALAIGIARQIVRKNVKPKKWIVKLNQGFSGKGNAVLDLQLIQNRDYPRSVSGDALVDYMANDIEDKLPEMKFECNCVSWNGNEYSGYKSQIKRLGVIAEAFLEGDNQSSPSVQAVVEDTDGEYHVHILSTHEQILNGQIYYGCANPASDLYRHEILAHAKNIGYKLAHCGVVGHYAVDFFYIK